MGTGYVVNKNFVKNESISRALENIAQYFKRDVLVFNVPCSRFSSHMHGDAVDFSLVGVDPGSAFRSILENQKKIFNTKHIQIAYYGVNSATGQHLHIEYTHTNKGVEFVQSGVSGSLSIKGLLASYPNYLHPCDEPFFIHQNQCAMRMSVCLIGAGMSLSDYNGGPKCKHGWATGAQSLATWLWNKKLGRPVVFDHVPIGWSSTKVSSYAKAMLNGKSGIIFFSNLFARAGESDANRSGDHIDVWYIERALSYNDPHNDAKEVWFWEIN